MVDMGAADIDIPIGTVFSSDKDNSPAVDHYLFIMDEKVPHLSARQGMFCYTFSAEGMLIGRIDEIFVSNEYFSNPQTVKKFDGGGVALSRVFPTDKWEDYIGYTRVISVYPYQRNPDNNIDNISYMDEDNIPPISTGIIKRPSFPAKPGGKVYLLTGELLRNFLGVTEKGLYLGNLENYDIPIKIDINRLLNKHFAVLAMSGAGKSYFISVLLEELLSRSGNEGTPGIVLFDVHGEYRFLTDISVHVNRKFAVKTEYYDARFIEIGVSKLGPFDFARFQPNMSNAQIRELKKVLAYLKGGEVPEYTPEEVLPDTEKISPEDIEIINERASSDKNGGNYDIQDIIEVIEADNRMNQKVKDALIGWLYELHTLKLFGKTENPPPEALVKPGKLSIIDLSTVISMKKKQIIVTYLTERLFNLRRRGKIAPFLIIFEEAHQFAPEGKLGESAITKYVIEMLAREGRKFYAQIGLVSQRPVKLSTTALSQCNTHIILRITNPNDLEHIKNSSEALTSESLRMLSTLPTGTALIMGAATNLPIFIRVRKRITQNPVEELSMEDVCKEYLGGTPK